MARPTASFTRPDKNITLKQYPNTMTKVVADIYL